MKIKIYLLSVLLFLSLQVLTSCSAKSDNNYSSSTLLEHEYKSLELCADIYKSKNLLVALDNSFAIYVALQKSEPQVFSDFVTLNNLGANDTHTLSLSVFRESNVIGLDTNNLAMSFSSGLKAEYLMKNAVISLKLNKSLLELEKLVSSDENKEKITLLKSTFFETFLNSKLNIYSLKASEAIKTLIKDQKDSDINIFNPSLPLFASEPEPGAIILKAMNDNSIQVTVYGKNKNKIREKIINSVQ